MVNVNKPTNHSYEYFEAIKKLSPRECEIIDLIADGKTSQQIAEVLYLSCRTVENHRFNICCKLGLKGRGALNKWISVNSK